jgi:hypothetical protein
MRRALWCGGGGGKRDETGHCGLGTWGMPLREGFFAKFQRYFCKVMLLNFAFFVLK